MDGWEQSVFNSVMFTKPKWFWKLRNKCGLIRPCVLHEEIFNLHWSIRWKKNKHEVCMEWTFWTPHGKIPKCITFAHYETLLLNLWPGLVNLEPSILVRTEREEAPLYSSERYLLFNWLIILKQVYIYSQESWMMWASCSCTVLICAKVQNTLEIVTFWFTG